MTPAEVIVLCFTYVALLIVGQRAAAFLLPEAQEIGFVIAGIAGALTAAVLYHLRQRRIAPKIVVFSVGATMAMLALVAGMVTQLLWQPMVYPYISLPIAAAVMIILPFILFPLGRKLAGRGEGGGGENADAGASGAHVLVAVTLMILVCIGAWQFPAPGRSILKLSQQTFPGIQVSLPDWATEKNVGMEAGTVRLTDPVGGDHFLSVRWTESEPVQPDDYIKAIATSMSMSVKARFSAFVSGHEGATFNLEAPDSGVQGAATVWNCPQDHRVMWIVTTISGPKASMLATHQRIVESIHCHAGNETRAGEKVFPGFTPPPGYQRQQGKSLVFLGPKRQTIQFDPAVPGRSDIVSVDLSPDQAATILKSTGLLTSIEGTPQLINVTDLSGHERRVWTATGAGSDGGRIQVEVMVWWCDQRDLSFVGTYATQGTHNVRDGVDTLLPAVCHLQN